MAASTTNATAYEPTGNRAASSEHNNWTYTDSRLRPLYPRLPHRHHSDGRQHTFTWSHDTRRYRYDDYGRLRSITLPDGGQIEESYRYDPVFFRSLQSIPQGFRSSLLPLDQDIAGV